MGQILESRQYDKFEMLSFNRRVDKTKALEESMRRHGFLDAYPLHVVKNGNGKLKIKAGHHRFTVARKLGIPVKYVISNDDATIHELEGATRPWKLEDYLVSYICDGKEDYAKIKHYHQLTGISIGCCMSMLAGQSAGSANERKKIKDGTYRVVADQRHANTVADIVIHCREEGIPWAANSLFVQALSKVVWVRSFDPERFKKKISTHIGLMQKQASKKDYVGLIDRVYNFASRTKIPLEFEADEDAKRRSAINNG